MRQWHRWTGICLALFLLVIGLTGVAVQVLDIIPQPPAAVATMAPASARAPEADSPAPKRAKPTGARAWSHWIKDIHSGRALGPFGIALSIASGIALMFFAVSGAWMYFQMFAMRKSIGRNSFFWKR